MSHGCCVDKLAGSGKPCTEATCMELPKGQTCGDCRTLNHCVAFYAVTPENTWCDFFPRRFVLRVVKPEVVFVAEEDS
jgi:hypothetical protein